MAHKRSSSHIYTLDLEKGPNRDVPVFGLAGGPISPLKIEKWL
jgi:hypothetical protein